MLLPYVGPPELRTTISLTRRRIRNPGDITDWARQCSHAHGEGDGAGDGAVIVTFIVNVRGGRIGLERRRNDVCSE